MTFMYSISLGIKHWQNFENQSTSAEVIITRAQQLLRWASVWQEEIRAEKWGLLCPFSGGGLVPHLTQCGLS